MTITVEIKPEVEAELAAQAAARGMNVSSYAASLLEKAAQPAALPKPRESLVEFFRKSPLVGLELDLQRDKIRAGTSSYERFPARYQLRLGNCPHQARTARNGVDAGCG